MTRFHRIAVLTLCAIVAAGSLLPTLNGAAPTRPPATAPGARSAQEIIADLRAADEQVRAAMPSLLALTDPEFRKGEGQKAVGPMKKMSALFGELEKVAPSEEARESVRMNRFRMAAYAGALGDAESLTTLDAASKGSGPDALSAKAGISMIRWLNASKDAAAQTKLLEDAATLAKANPASTEVAESLGFMANVGAASPDISKKVIEVIRTNLKGPEAKEMLAAIDGDQAMADAEKAQKEFIGKPLALEGRTSTGGTFNSDSLKGKVVLLDFWATWCGPCIAELPNVKKAYDDLHEQGFEIVGVSCDSNDEVLNSFIKEKSMPWVQLREESQTGSDQWHPLAKRYGVNGIPQMFLVDRKGVLRHVDARQDLEGKVKTLLAEPAAADNTAATKPAAK